MFKVGGKVRLKPAEELENPYWKTQEIGVGTIISLRGHFKDWCGVRWENGRENGYRHQGPNIDLIKVEEETSKMPTKEQVFEAVQKCPEARATLEILFPEYFEELKRKEMVPFKRGTYFKNERGAIAQLVCIDVDTWSFIDVADGNRWFSSLKVLYNNYCPGITLEEFYYWIHQTEHNWTPIKVDIVERTK